MSTTTEHMHPPTTTEHDHGGHDHDDHSDHTGMTHSVSIWI